MAILDSILPLVEDDDAAEAFEGSRWLMVSEFDGRRVRKAPLRRVGRGRKPPLFSA